MTYPHPMDDKTGFEYEEEACPGHVASKDNPKVCARCGVHVDSLRPPDDDE